MTTRSKFEKIVTAYQVLVQVAGRRETITYEEMARRIGVNNPQHVGRHLDPIAVHLRMAGLPALTVLVVSKGNQRPGSGLLAPRETFQEACRRAYVHSWDPDLFDSLLA